MAISGPNVIKLCFLFQILHPELSEFSDFSLDMLELLELISDSDEADWRTRSTLPEYRRSVVIKKISDQITSL